MSNASRYVPRPTTSVKNKDEFVEPYAHCSSNDAKLAAHMNAMLKKSTELLRSNIDSPYEDVNATLANADYFRRMIAEKTVTLPYCSNAVKFYTLLGAAEPGAMHEKLVKATHATLVKAWNQYTARKTVRTGDGFVRYVNKPHHLAELHDAHAFDHMIKTSSSLLPPVRPPASHSTKESKVSIYEEMPPLKPIADDEDEMLLEGPFSSAKDYVNRKRRDAAQKALTKADRALKKAQADKDAADSSGNPGKIREAEYRLTRAQQAFDNAERDFNRRDARAPVNEGIDNELSFEEDEELPPLGDTIAIEGLRDRLSRRKKKKKTKPVGAGMDDSLSLEEDEDEELPPLGAAISIDCHHDKKKKHHKEEVDSKMPPLRPIKSKMPELVPIKSQKPEASLETGLKSVDWLKQCVANDDIKLKAGKTYVFFAPSNTQIQRVVDHFAKQPNKVLSKERVISTHIAEHPGDASGNFTTFSGLSVVKNGPEIQKPLVANPRIQADAKGKVDSMKIAGALVYVLPHNNLFQ